MKAEDYHRSLRPLEEACRFAKSGWVCLPIPLTGGKRMILLRHCSLIFKIYKIRRKRILVREFSTLPLLFVFPLLWPFRKKIHFLINHNLQWAARSSVEHFGLTLLAKMGARWALFETQHVQGLEKFNIPSDKNLILPHPAPKSPPLEGCPKGGEGSPVVGVAGDYRPEKGMDELIGLLQKNFPRVGILLGVPNPEAVVHLDVEVVDTSTDEAYREMISRCDVLVSNQEKQSYFYRASGPIADAAACGTAVVAPDFPIIGKQVAGIGEVFQGLENMPEAVRRAVENTKAEKYNFSEYCAARSAQALANYLDGFSDGKS